MTIYNITDGDVGNWKPNVPDKFDPQTLQIGDKIGRVVEVDFVFYGHPDEPDPQASEHNIMLIYVASIQPHRTFKVYWESGERSDIEHCAGHGLKVRSKELARALFPMLNAYDFIST
jgi:hypothetical protein